MGQWPWQSCSAAMAVPAFRELELATNWSAFNASASALDRAATSLPAASTRGWYYAQLRCADWSLLKHGCQYAVSGSFIGLERGKLPGFNVLTHQHLHAIELKHNNRQDKYAVIVAPFPLR